MSENLPATAEEFKAPKLPDFASGAMVRPLIPQTFEQAWRIATVIFKGAMQPKDLDAPEKIMTVIMHGMEVGLSPMQAIQSIALINERPTIWGDAALALVFASGLMEAFKETKVEKDGTVIAICVVKRKGFEPQQGEFSLKQAAEAGLLNKAGPWKNYRDRMLQMRARSFALRDAFPDVFKGLGIREEVLDFEKVGDTYVLEPSPVSPTVIHAAQGAKPASDRKATSGESPDIPEQLDRRPKKEPPQLNPTEQAWVEEVSKGLAACKTQEAFNRYVTDTVNPNRLKFRAPASTHVTQLISEAWKALSRELLAARNAKPVQPQGTDSSTVGSDGP